MRQLIVGGLTSGLAKGEDELSVNLERLYEFVLFALDSGSVAKIQGALRVLSTLREGFQGIRQEAVQLEAHRRIPAVDSRQLVGATV